MATLKVLKEKMSGIKKTAKVTKAMESLSAIKMRYAQQKALDGRYYVFWIFSILKRISKIVGDGVDDLFLKTAKINGKNVILLISPDKGLTGGMNNFLFKKVEEVIVNNNFDKENLSFVCVGKKGYEYVKKRGFEVEKYFDGIGEKSSLEEINKVSDFIKDFYNNEEVSQVLIIFTEFINTTEQTAKVRILLPVIYTELKEVIKSILPNKGKYSDEQRIQIDETDVNDYIFEPDISKIIEHLTPFVLRISVYYSLLESFASEHSARMVAMKNSTDKANELAEGLRKEYNKKRQAAVTQEISEIVSGMESMKK